MNRVDFRSPARLFYRWGPDFSRLYAFFGGIQIKRHVELLQPDWYSRIPSVAITVWLLYRDSVTTYIGWDDNVPRRKMSRTPQQWRRFDYRVLRGGREVHGFNSLEDTSDPCQGSGEYGYHRMRRWRIRLHRALHHRSPCDHGGYWWHGCDIRAAAALDACRSRTRTLHHEDGGPRAMQNGSRGETLFTPYWQAETNTCPSTDNQLLQRFPYQPVPTFATTSLFATLSHTN